MTYILQYFDEVEIDVSDAKNWYKEQKVGLEIEFANAIEKALKHVVKAPKTYAIRYKKVRIAHPKKFPYNNHFYINNPNSTVVTTAIIHNKRRLNH